MIRSVEPTLNTERFNDTVLPEQIGPKRRLFCGLSAITGPVAAANSKTPRPNVEARSKRDAGAWVALDIHMINEAGLQAAGVERRGRSGSGPAPGIALIRAPPDTSVIACVNDRGCARSKTPGATIDVSAFGDLRESHAGVVRQPDARAAPIDDVVDAIARRTWIDRDIIGGIALAYPIRVGRTGTLKGPCLALVHRLENAQKVAVGSTRDRKVSANTLD
jgi:hypothetical protein